MPPQQTSFLAACRGQKPDRTPIWIMRQAGRYLPEYREIRAKIRFRELIRSPELCAEVTLQPLERFDLDAAILFSDILVVFDAIGINVDFNPAPKIEAPIRSGEQAGRLRFGTPEEHLGYVFDAVRACKRALADRVPLIGFCGAPFTTVSYLVEGGSSQAFQHTKTFMFKEPEAFRDLMASVTELLCQYLQGQVMAGVDALQVFDSWAGALAPADYREHVLPHIDKMVRRCGSLGVPLILFARGNANVLELIKDSPADVLGIDWTIDLDRAIDVVGTDKVVQGNLDPMAMLATAELVERKARAIVAAGRRARGHIFNLGHGISPHTDPSMVERLIDAVRSA